MVTESRAPAVRIVFADLLCRIVNQKKELPETARQLRGGGRFGAAMLPLLDEHLLQGSDWNVQVWTSEVTASPPVAPVNPANAVFPRTFDTMSTV